MSLAILDFKTKAKAGKLLDNKAIRIEKSTRLFSRTGVLRNTLIVVNKKRH